MNKILFFLILSIQLIFAHGGKEVKIKLNEYLDIVTITSDIKNGRNYVEIVDKKTKDVIDSGYSKNAMIKLNKPLDEYLVYFYINNQRIIKNPLENESSEYSFFIPLAICLFFIFLSAYYLVVNKFKRRI